MIRHIQMNQVNSAIGDIYFKEKLFDRSLGFYREAANLRAGDLNALEKIGDSFSQNLRPDSAKFYFNQVLFQIKKKDDLVGQIRLYQKLADAHNRFPDSLDLTKNALDYLLSMRRLVEMTGDKNAQTVLFNKASRTTVANGWSTTFDLAGLPGAGGAGGDPAVVKDQLVGASGLPARSVIPDSRRTVYTVPGNRLAGGLMVITPVPEL